MGLWGALRINKEDKRPPKCTPDFPQIDILIEKENIMMIETMTEGKNKYQVELLKKENFNKKFLQSVLGTVYLMADHSTVASMNKYQSRVAKLENNGFTSFDFHYQNGFFIGHFKKKVAQ